MCEETPKIIGIGAKKSGDEKNGLLFLISEGFFLVLPKFLVPILGFCQGPLGYAYAGLLSSKDYSKITYIPKKSQKIEETQSGDGSDNCRVKVNVHPHPKHFH